MIGCFCWALLLVTGGSVSAAPLPSALPDGAKVVYRDDFNRKELGSYQHIRRDGQPEFEPQILSRFHWRERGGTWEIRQAAGGNGYLYGTGQPGSVVLTDRLACNFRVEYTAWSETPGDRSLRVCVPLEGHRFEDVYFFGVSSYAGTQNQLLRGAGGAWKPMAESKTAPLPKPGERYRVVIQNRDGLLEMFINGETVFSVKDADYMSVLGKFATQLGVNVALEVWSNQGAAFDDLVVYDLPQGQAMAGDGKAAQSFYEGFQGVPPGPVPGRVTVQAGPGCSAAVVDEPTVQYRPREPLKDNLHRLVPDPCVELKGAGTQGGATASMTVPFAPIDSGEVEAEILAWLYTGEAGEVSLVRPDGSTAATLVLGPGRDFSTRTTKGTRRLQGRVSFPYHGPEDTPVCFQAKRWFTLRFSFDAAAGLWHIAIVNLCGPDQQEVRYVVLGDDLPLSGKGPVSGLRVTADARARLLVDNICMASPRSARINNQPRTEPLRAILGLGFPLRQDPVSLWVNGLRNDYLLKNVLWGTTVQDARGWYCRPPTARFIKTEQVYDRLLVRYALLEDRAQMLRRMVHYLQGGARKAPSEAGDTLADIGAFSDDLDRLMRVYGTAFRDGLNEQRLDTEFDPLAARLEQQLSGLEGRAEALGQACVAATGRKLEPAPALLPGPDDAPIEWKNGRYVRAGQPALFYFPYAWWSEMAARGDYDEFRLLGLENCFTAPDPRVPLTTQTWQSFAQWIRDNALKGNPEARLFVCSLLGAHDVWQWCPADWLDQRKNDPDILFRNRDGSYPNWRGETRPYVGNPPDKPEHYHAMLNFWHPDVQQLTRDVVGSYARNMNETFPGRMQYFQMTWEGLNYAGTETGFNENAVQAFRAYLKDEHRTIAALNNAWGTSYQSFDEIDQRKYDPARPNGLMYEFQCFRQKGYWDWVRLVKTSLHQYAPYAPLTCDTVCAGHREVDAGHDMPSLFQNFDLVDNHGYGLPSDQRDVVLPLMDSLRKAYGTPIGVFEWAGPGRNGDIFNEQAEKACGLMDMFEMLAWGRSMMSFWGVSTTARVPSLGLSLLRYSTGYIPVGCLRARRFGSIALNYPTVTPKVVVMEATSSWLNHIGTATTMLHVRTALAAGQWNHGVVYENALLDGKQSLKGVETVILPRGVCLKPAASRLLLDWIKQGGTLIALLPPGYYNEYGRPDGTLLRTAMGELEGTFNPGFAKFTLESVRSKEGPAAVRPMQGDGWLTARYGQGRLCVYTAAEPPPSLMNLVARYTTRDMVTKSGRFHLVLRESDRHRYVFAVNHDLYQDREDTIVLAGRHAGVVDLGCDAAFPVPATVTDRTTEFTLRLAPGEGTVIRLDKSAGNR